ncbi:MAG: hypothetical protein IKL59_03445 [Clostridia bacterium]|nr:hypothetical protein [Clostridia bacterium]
MIFQENHTTRWHDTDAFRRVTPTQMLVYMQEASNHHMDSVGMPLDTLRDEKRLAFILSKMRLAIYAPLYAFEDITVQTWTCPGRAFSTERFYRIKRGEQIIADAMSTWALIDIDKKLPVTQSESGLVFEDEAAPKLDVPLRFRLPKDVELISLGKRRIVYSDLDYNMHMNNTKYTNMLCDFMPIDEVGKIKGVLLCYVNEAAFGDEIEVLCAKVGNEKYFRTVNSRGETCLEAHMILD